VDSNACIYCQSGVFDYSFYWVSTPDGAIAGTWGLSLPSLQSNYSFEGLVTIRTYFAPSGTNAVYCYSGFVLTTPDGDKHTFPNRTGCNVPDGNVEQPRKFPSAGSGKTGPEAALELVRTV